MQTRVSRPYRWPSNLKTRLENLDTFIDKILAPLHCKTFAPHTVLQELHDPTVVVQGLLQKNVMQSSGEPKNLAWPEPGQGIFAFSGHVCVYVDSFFQV